MEPPAYTWVWASTNGTNFHEGALRAGTDSDGSEIYAGRAEHERDSLAAKVIPSKNVCYVSYGGQEIAKDSYELLVPARFVWQRASNGNVPDNAVSIGYTYNEELLYMGRVHHDGCVTPGKIHPSMEGCFYPYNGEERHSSDYEVLIVV